MRRVIAIDPGTRNTGLAYCEPWRLLAYRTITSREPIGADQEALRRRSLLIADEISGWMADKPHDLVVIEGFVPQRGRMSAATYQTPFLCGVLECALRGERTVIQLAHDVLRRDRAGNPTNGSMAWLMDALKEGRSPVEGFPSMSNEHIRSAVCHAMHFFENGDKQ